MIVFDLACRAGGHRFEGWFGSSDDFASQQAQGLVACPQCHSPDVFKAPMAPNLARKGNQVEVSAPAAATRPERISPMVASSPAVTGVAAPKVPPPKLPPALPPEAVAMLQAFARLQAEALKASRWVGEKFADDARAMHYGDKDHTPIHGQATGQEVHELLEEGIEIAPILFPLAPPGHLN